MKALLFSLVLAAFGMYPETGKVIEIDRTNDIVSVETSTGYVYEFYGAEDWDYGDCCSMIMHNNKTEIVFDDMVIKAQYSGF